MYRFMTWSSGFDQLKSGRKTVLIAKSISTLNNRRQLKSCKGIWKMRKHGEKIRNKLWYKSYYLLIHLICIICLIDYHNILESILDNCVIGEFSPHRFLISSSFFLESWSITYPKNQFKGTWYYFPLLMHISWQMITVWVWQSRNFQGHLFFQISLTNISFWPTNF